MLGKHRLAARNNRHSLFEGRLDDVIRIVGIVDHLNHEINLLVLQNILGAIGQEGRIDRHAARLAQIMHADLDNLGMGVSRLTNHLIDTLSYDTEAKKTDFNVTHRVPNL